MFECQFGCPCGCSISSLASLVRFLVSLSFRAILYSAQKSTLHFAKFKRPYLVHVVVHLTLFSNNQSINRCDKSGDGILDCFELTSTVRRSFKITQAILSDADIRWLFTHLDEDNSGGISVEELVRFVGGNELVVRRPSERGRSNTRRGNH